MIGANENGNKSNAGAIRQYGDASGSLTAHNALSRVNLCAPRSLLAARLPPPSHRLRVPRMYLSPHPLKEERLFIPAKILRLRHAFQCVTRTYINFKEIVNQILTK